MVSELDRRLGARNCNIAVCLFFGLLIGLPLYLMGCNSVIGGNCSAYKLKQVEIELNECFNDSMFRCLKGSWDTGRGQRLACWIQTDPMCAGLTRNRCRLKFRQRYPVGSNATLNVGSSDDVCRSPGLLSNLAIAGLAVLMLAAIAATGVFVESLFWTAAAVVVDDIEMRQVGWTGVPNK